MIEIKSFDNYNPFDAIADALENNHSPFDRLVKQLDEMETEAREKAKCEKKHIVFISVPMAGRDTAVIRREIQVAEAQYLRIRGWDAREVAFITNLNCPKAPEHLDVDQASAWYLGEAIKKMAGCDEALFIGKWRQARGCIMERQVCTLYGIPIREINGYIRRRE